MGQIVFSSNELNFLILQNGKDGTPADSKYTWVKYSQNEDGNPLTDNPEDAVYIGIAYNKDSAIESDNPSDYSWTKIKGNDGSDAYTIVLDNQNVSFSTSSSGIVLSDQSFECDVSVYQGTEERDDFTLGEVSSSSGITVSKSNNTIILSATMGTQITSDSGVVSVPVSIDGLIFLPKITWSQSKQGAQGIPGTGSINVVLANESQAINCTSDGLVSSNVLITIPFSAYKGVEQIASTAVVGVLPSGMTLGSNTPSTATESGEIILNVAANATLGNANVTSGEIPITITADSIEIIKHFVWTKVNNGKDGAIFVLDVSDVVVTKNYDGSYTPSQVTLNAYYQYDGERIPYEGRFIIQASYYGEYLLDEDENYLTDGDDEALIIENRIASDYSDVYVSSEDESTYTYNFDFNSVSGLICYLCEAGTVTNILDQQSVTVISNLDTVVPVIDKITTTMTGLETSVDNINNQIINKVWQTDITESINHYDGTTTNEIRDQIAQQQISIGEIQTTVSDTTSKFEEDIQTLTEKTSELEQDAEGFKQTVSEQYATKSELENTSETLQSSITQTAGEINQEITDLEGNISTIEQSIDTIEQSVQDVNGDISQLQQTAQSITQSVEDANENITQLQQTATTLTAQVGNKQDIKPTRVRYIRDWIKDNNVNTTKRWTDIEVFVPDTSSLSGEKNIAQGRTPTSDISISNLTNYTDNNPNTYVTSTTSGWHYLQIDLGASNAFDAGYITVYHYVDTTTPYYVDQNGNVLTVENYILTAANVSSSSTMMYDHRLEISADGQTWFTLFDSDKNGRYIETPIGKTYYIGDNMLNDAMSTLKMSVNAIEARVEDSEGNFAEMTVEVDGITQRVVQTEVDVDNAQNSANVAQDSADEANEAITDNTDRLTIAESIIEQLSNSISTIITDADGNSMMTQTSTGWQFDISSIVNSLDEALNTVNNLTVSIGNLGNTVDNLDQLMDDISEKTAYIIMATDSEGNPCIELGKEGNDFKVRISNTSVDFMEGTSRIAYVSNSSLFIEKAIIKNELQIGEGSGFIWKTRSNGNMGLRWVEEE